jgi:hypothetical protein
MTTSSRLRRSLYSACFALCAATIALPAYAQQPSAADLESARELYKEAKALREKGDLRGALERFKAAHAYGQTPVTALELGRTHMQLGELVEAREVLLSVARMKVQPDETERSAAARSEAADLAEQIKPKIPTLVVKLQNVPSGSEPQLTVDGAPVPVVSQSAVRKTNPGAHVVVARAGGREEKRNVDLKEGESHELAIAFSASSPPAGGEGASGGGVAAPPGADTAHGKKSISPVTWIGLGVAVAGIGVGSVAGIIALGKSKTVKDECKGTSCPPSARDDVDAGRSAATFSTIGFAAGAAGLAVAAVGWFVLSKPETASSAPQVRAGLAPGGVVLDGAF